jgi:hypothetical protein
MDPNDVALLLVLGAADECATPIGDICRLARLIAPRDWQPTRDVITAAAEQAIREGLVVMIDDADGTRSALETTNRGRLRAAALLRKPIARTSGSFTRTCMSVKLCFLNLLPLPDRSAEAIALAALYREAIALVRRLLDLSPMVAGAALQDLRCDLLHLDSELAWLEGMTAWQRLSHAAE